MTSFSDIIALTDAKIAESIRKEEYNTMALRMKIVGGQEKNVSKAKKQKALVARLKTAKRQRELGLSPNI